jgi:hypothetical protein
MRIVVRVVQAVVIAMLVVVTISVVRGAGGSAAEPSLGNASGGTELVLGPTGIGKLKLGMSEQQATATGQARMSPDWKSTGSSTCSIETVDGVAIHFSRHHGLAVLTASERVSTPEGIRAGASVDEVAAAYPTLSHPDLGTPREQVQMFGEFTVPVPANPDAIYVFFFHLGGGTPRGDAGVRYILLSLREQDEECTHAS